MVISSNQFSDVSRRVGIRKDERTWGANWVDFNGDTLPDLYVNNHQDDPNLYLNQGDGTFQDIAPSTMPFLKRDNHGAAWADFDNDGDPDLMQVAGGATGIIAGEDPQAQSIRQQLYVNNNGQLKDQATELGVAYPLNRGRTPLWVDIDNDGNLDLSLSGAIQQTGLGRSTLFQQVDGQFIDIGPTAGFNVAQSPFGFLADLAGDDGLELNIARNGAPRLAVYKYNDGSLIDIRTRAFPQDAVPGFKDVAVADFNGDLLTDIYLPKTSASVRSSVVTVDDLGRVAARLTGQDADEVGYSFNARGEIILDLFLAPPLQPNEIYIGAQGLKAENFSLDLITREGLFPGEWQLKLSPDNARVAGLPPEAERESQTGIYIGYDPDIKQWTVLAAGQGKKIDVVVSQARNNTFSNVQSINLDDREFKRKGDFFFGTEQGLEDRTDFSKINDTLNAAASVVAGDFDNDMDVDIYTVTTEPSENTPNVLYENQGDGTFRAVRNAGGAEGTSRGRGDAVVTADYDLDGFLDLFITNGAWPPLLAEEGPHQLLRNRANDNHWLQIDLEGVVSNRDGIGAKVYVTAGGVTQVREQSGGMHLYSQNHQRLHFGLAKNTTVEKVLVVWPDGNTQEINNISSDQLIKIVEEPETPFTPGAPNIRQVDAPGVFVWRETFDGPYKLRVVGKPGESINYKVDLIAHEPLTEVTPIRLNPGDSLTESEFGFSLESTVQGSQDGVDFQLKPGTSALLSITENGVANPRQLYVGSEAGRLAPAGWILNSEDLPTRPDFKNGKDLGLFVGQGNNPSTLEFRWTGDGRDHSAELNVLTSTAANFKPVRLSREDEFSAGNNEAQVTSRIQSRFDGLNVVLPEPTTIGFTYDQDGFNQPHRINQADASLGFQNAYELPIVTPYGKPDYDIKKDRGLFLWKDETRGVWKLRAIAGNQKFKRFKGSIVADKPIRMIDEVSLEPNDILGSPTRKEITFDFKVRRNDEDGIDFRLPQGVSAELSLGTNRNGSAQLVNVGAQQWEISALPLELGGWDSATQPFTSENLF